MWRSSHLVLDVVDASQILSLTNVFISPSATELRGGLSGCNIPAQAGLSMNTLHRVESGQF